MPINGSEAIYLPSVGRVQKELNYDDVYLVPQKCVLQTRSEADISVEFGGRRFSNPVIAANMESVVDFNTCKYLGGEKNMFYIMHRYGIEPAQIKEFIADRKEAGSFSSISIGIKQKDEELVLDLISDDLIPDYITIDVAHAHSERVGEYTRKIRNLLPEVFLIVGNVATAEGVLFLEECGANAIKLFIAPGHACTTKIKTGFTRGTISCLLECSKAATVPLIADGGIHEPGHISKAIAAGATMVMAGFFMSGFDQNSGKTILINGEKKYIYYGSASFNIKQHNDHIEGTQILVDYKGDMGEHIHDIECSLKSAVSYAGKERLMDLYGTPMIRF